MRLFPVLFFPFRPRLLILRLLEDRRKLSLAVYGLLLIGGLYTITVYIGHRHGFGAVLTPFLRIPAEQYYPTSSWRSSSPEWPAWLPRAFMAGAPTKTPSMLITMWLPESLVMIAFPSQRSTPLGGFRFWPVWIDSVRQLAGVLWPLSITIYGIRISEKTSVAQSILVGLVLQRLLPYRLTADGMLQ
jgi:hypothetical protein